MVAIFSGNLAEGKTSTINGTGEQTRDYVYVEDVARANVLALEDEVPSGAYNAGTGSEAAYMSFTSCYWGSQVRILLLYLVRPSRARSVEARWILPSPGAS